MVFFFFLLSSRLWMDNHFILLIYKNFNTIFVNVKTKNFSIHSFIRSFIHSSIHSTNTACTKFYLLSHAQGVKKQFSARAHYHILFSILSFLPALISSVQNSIFLASLPLSGTARISLFFFAPKLPCMSFLQAWSSVTLLLFAHANQVLPDLSIHIACGGIINNYHIAKSKHQSSVLILIDPCPTGGLVVFFPSHWSVLDFLTCFSLFLTSACWNGPGLSSGHFFLSSLTVLEILRVSWEKYLSALKEMMCWVQLRLKAAAVL